MINVTTGIILDTRRIKKDGSYPAKLRICHLRKRKYYSIGKSYTETDFVKIEDKKSRGWHKEERVILNAITAKAEDAIKKIEQFSFSAFERKFFISKTDRESVYFHFQEYIDFLNKQARVNTADSYRSALNSLIAFKRSLSFNEVTVEFLNRYEAWMKSEDRSPSTVGIYIRSLRTIINNAIKQGDLVMSNYPFGKHGYQIPNSRNIKKALRLRE
ncbi:MAG TPA: phage integrase SAM-like domain and Arm DNA-binding domain-containing protein, partial [Cyclobacteriaceae bacterium]